MSRHKSLTKLQTPRKNHQPTTTQVKLRSCRTCHYPKNLFIIQQIYQEKDIYQIQLLVNAYIQIKRSINKLKNSLSQKISLSYQLYPKNQIGKRLLEDGQFIKHYFQCLINSPASVYLHRNMYKTQVYHFYKNKIVYNKQIFQLYFQLFSHRKSQKLKINQKNNTNQLSKRSLRKHISNNNQQYNNILPEQNKVISKHNIILKTQQESQTNQGIHQFLGQKSKKKKNSDQQSSLKTPYKKKQRQVAFNNIVEVFQSHPKYLEKQSAQNRIQQKLKGIKRGIQMHQRELKQLKNKKIRRKVILPLTTNTMIQLTKIEKQILIIFPSIKHFVYEQKVLLKYICTLGFYQNHYINKVLVQFQVFTQQKEDLFGIQILKAQKRITTELYLNVQEHKISLLVHSKDGFNK